MYGTLLGENWCWSLLGLKGWYPYDRMEGVFQQKWGSILLKPCYKVTVFILSCCCLETEFLTALHACAKERVQEEVTFFRK